ncbi:PstS family phosphate ABC transporter substrate-binding protein [Marinicellulosiphila megalodicopiae]|uniref:PstS family phosphate ABC transporter substrate-binding protein n=1 Tax=Marinicellulosiphila megalodicopiae TaxID=2724896 RepID=UPI003BAE7F0F
MKLKLASISIILAASAVSSVAVARDNIWIVGSSTVYPFATVVAEKFGKETTFKTPSIESTGSGGGLKMFCEGVGENTPDITNSSRRIKSSEVELCAKNGITEIIEVKVGYDGIALANTKKAVRFELTRKDIFLALAKQVPTEKEGELIENPYITWNEVNPSLPNQKIEVLGPPPTSGTRDAFVELAMEGGCKKIAWIAELKKTDSSKYKAICHGIREDGHFIEAGENDNLIVNKLEANPNALGIFGFSFLDQNAEKVQGSLIDGAAPTFDSIADGEYVVSRPLYFYVKKAHLNVIPGISEYLATFTDKKAMGEEGYLTDKGMIPLPASEFKKVQNAVKNRTNLTL